MEFLSFSAQGFCFSASAGTTGPCCMTSARSDMSAFIDTILAWNTSSLFSQGSPRCAVLTKRHHAFDEVCALRTLRCQCVCPHRLNHACQVQLSNGKTGVHSFLSVVVDGSIHLYRVTDLISWAFDNNHRNKHKVSAQENVNASNSRGHGTSGSGKSSCALDNVRPHRLLTVKEVRFPRVQVCQQHGAHPYVVP